MPALNWGDDEDGDIRGLAAGDGAGEEHIDPSALRLRNRCPQVAQLMLGGASIGCLFKEVTPESARDCIDRAVEAGIRYVDTSPWYGAGLSESRLGEALGSARALRGGRRDEVLVSTKCGRFIVPKAGLQAGVHRTEADYEAHFFTDRYHMDRVCWDYTGDGIRESVRQSCARLQRPAIDCMRLHDAENKERFAAATAPGGAVDAMIALKAAGTVRELSLGMNSERYIMAFLRKYPGVFDNIMLSNCFNLIDHGCIGLLLECQKQNVRIHNVGVFASGLLWGGDHYMYDSDVPAEVKEKVARWTALAGKYELALPQLALNFAFLPDIVDYAAFGTSRAAAVDQNVALCGNTVPVALWAEAQEIGILDPRLPLPSADDSAGEGAAKKQKVSE
jgi:D-threo-aldose 1-dehydrogenase